MLESPRMWLANLLSLPEQKSDNDILSLVFPSCILGAADDTRYSI
jgi:hypothetical protein